jgi:protein-disulfide isomerase
MKSTITLLILYFLVGCASSVYVDKDHKNPANRSLGSGPVVEFFEKEILLGPFISPQEYIIGSIPIYNAGSETLEIKKVYGPCTCFKGYSGDRTILPGQGGEVEVRFDPSQIPSGKVKRLIRIETNDPIHPTTEVNFAFNIQRSPEQEENRNLQAEVTKLRAEVASLRKDVDALSKQPSPRTKSAAKSQEDTRIYDIPMGDSPVMGRIDAPITIAVFSDFQCPYCVQEFPKIQKILSEYPNKVKMVYKHFPLAFHKQAPTAHAAAIAALNQKGNDGFWKIHDMILSEPKKLDTASLRIYAEALGLDLAELEKQWADPTLVSEQLKADKELAVKCNVRGTPTIFVNGLKLSDRSLDGYRKRIDSIQVPSEETKVGLVGK